LLNEARAVEERATGNELGLRLSEAMTRANLATLAYVERDYAAAANLLEESCAIWRSIDNRWGLALALSGLGFVNHTRGHRASARVLSLRRVSRCCTIIWTRWVCRTCRRGWLRHRTQKR
jgi:hypothetical protein